MHLNFYDHALFAVCKSHKSFSTFLVCYTDCSHQEQILIAVYLTFTITNETEVHFAKTWRFEYYSFVVWSYTFPGYIHFFKLPFCRHQISEDLRSSIRRKCIWLKPAILKWRMQFNVSLILNIFFIISLLQPRRPFRALHWAPGSLEEAVPPTLGINFSLCGNALLPFIGLLLVDVASHLGCWSLMEVPGMGLPESWLTHQQYPV